MVHRRMRRRLDRVSELQAALAKAADDSEADALSSALSRARAGLSTVRADVSRQAQGWNLRYAKTMLRSYRELARAGRSPTET